MLIDTSFDVRTDAGGRDPDTYSPTLRRYHQFLWSKPLPGGSLIELDTTTPHAYLHHRSEIGELWWSSDSVVTTFRDHGAARSVVGQLAAEELDEFLRAAYTIGAMLVFPGDKRGPSTTINGARGLHPRIRDRIDLTLECIRRHYLGEPSPLADVLARYADFFALFEDFRGYVDFFLLQDLVTDDGAAVRFFTPFADFTTPAIPPDVEVYREYMRASIAFVEARNRRIAEWAAAQPASGDDVLADIVPLRPTTGAGVQRILAEDAVGHMLRAGMMDDEIVAELARQGIQVSIGAVAALRHRMGR